MPARLVLIAIISALLFVASGCCVRQGAHSVNRLWMDWDTYYAPSYCMESINHLPYQKERVGYFRWMYNKDPGHQYAKLGPLPPRGVCDPDCPSPCDIQGQGGGGIPGSTDSLWLSGIPQPVDATAFLPPQPPPEGFSPQNTATAPAPAQGASSGTRPASAPNVVPPPSLKLPAGDPPSAYYGPTAQRWGGFRENSNTIPPMSATANRPAAAAPIPPVPSPPARVAEKKSSMPQGEWLLLH